MYQKLVEESIEYKRFSRQILSDHFNVLYQESESARYIDVSEGYTLQCDQADGKFYCLATEQTL